MIDKYEKINDEAREYILNELNQITTDKDILGRCKKEVDILYKSSDLFIIEYLYIYKKDNQNIDYHFRGMSNNLLLLYILGLSIVNPIKYNLSYELCNSLCDIDFINGSYLDFLDVIEIIENDFKLIRVANDERNHYIVFPNDCNYDLLFRLKEGKFEVIVNDILNMYDYIILTFNDKKIEKSVFNNDFEKELEKTLLPKTFDDYVKVKSLAHGTDVWSYNQEELFKKGIVNLNNIISNRDDVYDYLINHNIDGELALIITTFIRKGKGARDSYKEEWSKYKEILKQHNCEEWFIEVCSKIRYLFGRGQAVSECLYVYGKSN